MEPLPAPSAKRGWPLLVLGACAFVPGFGIFFGAAAVTWGLVSDRPRAKWGVLLGGAGALRNMVGGAVLVGRFEHTPVVERSRIEVARSDPGAVVKSMGRDREHSGSSPYTCPDREALTIPPLPINYLYRP